MALQPSNRPPVERRRGKKSQTDQAEVNLEFEPDGAKIFAEVAAQNGQAGIVLTEMYQARP